MCASDSSRRRSDAACRPGDEDTPACEWPNPAQPFMGGDPNEPERGHLDGIDTGRNERHRFGVNRDNLCVLPTGAISAPHSPPRPCMFAIARWHSLSWIAERSIHAPFSHRRDFQIVLLPLMLQRPGMDGRPRSDFMIGAFGHPDPDLCSASRRVDRHAPAYYAVLYVVASTVLAASLQLIAIRSRDFGFDILFSMMAGGGRPLSLWLPRVAVLGCCHQHWPEPGCLSVWVSNPFGSVQLNQRRHVAAGKCDVRYWHEAADPRCPHIGRDRG